MISPVTPDMVSDLFDGKLFRTVPTGTDWALVRDLLSSRDEDLHRLMDRDSADNIMVSGAWSCGRGHLSDLARMLLYARGLLPELEYPPVTGSPS